MASEVPRFFTSLAERLGVIEVDVLLLRDMGIYTCNDLASRLDSKARLDEYVEDVARIRTATMDPEDFSIAVEDVPDPMDARTFSREARVGNLRRLWESSTLLAKKDLDDLVNVTGVDKPKQIGTLVYLSMIEEARKKGLRPMTPQTTPGPLTIAKVVNNFRPQGPFAYLEWEEYVSEQDENQARRTGGAKSDEGSFKIFKSSEGFMLGVEDQLNIVRDTTVNLEPAQQFLIVCDLWALRANTHQIAALCLAEEYASYTFHFEVAFKKNPMMAFRAATMNEIRCCDRSVHQEFLPWVGNGSATLSQCLEWYSTNRDSHAIFQIIDSAVKELPDRGIEQPPSARYSEGSGTPGQTRPQTQQGQKRQTDNVQSPACMVCGKPRFAHTGGRFCKLDQIDRAKGGKGVGSGSDRRPPPGRDGGGSRPRGSGAKGGAANSAGRRGKDQPRAGKQGKMPAHMAGCALATPSTKEFPGGESFCWDFNNPDKGCRTSASDKKYGASCNRVHLCPKFIASGAICMANHAAFNCR